MIFNYLYKFLLKKFIKQLNVMKSKLLQFRYLKIEGWVRLTKKNNNMIIQKSVFAYFTR